MLVTPSMSARTVMPATMVANHKNVLRRENAGRSNSIAFHHEPHSDYGRSRSDIVPIHGCVGSGLLVRDQRFIIR